MMDVFVQVVPLNDVDRGCEIGWGSDAAETLVKRLADIKAAISSGVSALADGLSELRATVGWEVSEVKGTFGLTLAAEAGVILTKASTECTFEVEVTFTPTAEAATTA